MFGYSLWRAGWLDEGAVACFPVSRVELPLGRQAEPPGVDAGVAEGRQQALDVEAALAEQGAHPPHHVLLAHDVGRHGGDEGGEGDGGRRSEEHTSELQSLMRISYAVFCLKKKKKKQTCK